MKKLATLLSLFAATAMFADINVYSSRHYDSDKLVIDAFTKETGIKVNVIQDKVQSLIQKLELEGKDTTADVFMTVGVGDLYTAKTKGLLQPLNSKVVEKNVSPNLMDKDKNWIGVTYRARILAYDPAKTDIKELSTYEALSEPKFKDKILTRSSTASYNRHLIAFLIAKDGEQATQKWADGLVKNFARSPKGNDRDQAKAIVAGEGEIAIMNSYYIGRMSVSKDPVEQEVYKTLRIFFPNQNDGGTHINLSGAGITKYSKNYDEAAKFIEFLTTTKAQELFVNNNFEFPTNPSVKLPKVMKDWGEFKASKIDFDEIGKNLVKAQEIADKANWK
ncbi:Fe(3+) ABC transporter substrate-binding protein [Campylobacter geochelonis]|uniref:Iron ABC transporter periplasmic iron-binding protein n=1 Tax=Campylobacter geochelonis TaxID=1780362 RepID=A0A128EGT7_9BACT|nr:Fe(3+) ABC transporter substrate-binding protein [Campylobacter geochelonis]QKF70796.1 iron(III) ABC transporter, periplasmic iron-binding protein [Campylobacter geochelonis]CZE47359.1 iron ABC transporter periplasmic iron-binding protein [Campylobacter geochelonis]CZE48114.1 iron ABC transporter periplasmic iron-binding protein [Campylobacter geochelonis]CZE50565.1 iron ABC transporter periplasmic iron-binding protein [Campylobacter geochelonis]